MTESSYDSGGAGQAIRRIQRGRGHVASDATQSGDARKATVRTVAAAAGVSTATVSRVMSGVSTVKPELAARVRQVAEELNYRPSEAARGLALGAMRNIGALMPDLRNAFFQDIVKSMHDVAADSGFRMLIADHSSDPSDEFATAWDLMGHVDGLALISSRIESARLRELGRQSTPVVLVNRVELGLDLPMVGIDSFTAMLEICAHLAELGHRRIVYMSGSQFAWNDQERWRGVQTSSRFLNIHATRVESDGTIETSHAAVEKALEHEPTALVCFNDLSAIGAISKLRELGLDVPGDISVTGFDDIVMGRHVFPTLTTASSSWVELGRQAWKQLHASLDKRDVSENAVLLPAKLVVRQSTGPARIQ